MSTKLKAGTATSGAVIDADTTGILELQSGSTPTTAITVDTAQNVGIGTASPSYKLDVNGQGAIRPASGDSQMSVISAGANYATYQIANSTNRYSMQIRTDLSNSWTLRDETAGANRLVVDSSGNLLAGKTASGQILATGFEYNNTSGAQYLSICNNTAGNTALWVANNATSGTRQLVGFYAGSSSVGSITYNGTVTLYNTTSDERLKENVVDAGSGLDKLANIKIRAFDWKESGMHTDFGVVAQEINEVAPELVSIGTDNEDGTIKNPWQVDTSTLVPAMIKAIQELKTQVDAQAAEIQILKGAA